MSNFYDTSSANSIVREYASMLEHYPFIVDTEEKVYDYIRWQTERDFCETEIEAHMSAKELNILVKNLKAFKYDVEIAEIDSCCYRLIVCWS
nr:MAG TPA: hypothetical protein [Caudoviricetes sp.]